MSFRTIAAVTRKEIHHILRDRATFILVLLAPTILLFLMAYAVTTDIKDVPIAVLDRDQSSLSRQFVERITAGEDLQLKASVQDMDEIESLLQRGQIKAAVVIDPSFSSDLVGMRGMPVLIIIDGTEPESGSFAVEHVGWRAEEFVYAALADQLQSMGLSSDSMAPVDLRVRAWYNPGLKPRVDVIPGLLSMVMGFPALSVALTLAHEREHGTLEQLLASPVRRTELIIGKMVPYVLVGMANVIFLPLLAVLWFKVPFNGNFLLFFFLSVIFLFSILSLGVVVGVFMRTQAAALALSFLLIFFPGFFMTGIFFPIASMPEMMRMEALGLPGTHYAIITRSAFLTAVGLDVLWPYVVMMAFLGVAFTSVAALFFKKRLA